MGLRAHMAHDTLLTIFVIIAALALAGQAAAMLGLYFSLRDVPRQIEDVRRSVSDRIDPLADSVKEILSSSREPVRTITRNLAEISQVLLARSRSTWLISARCCATGRAAWTCCWRTSWKRVVPRPSAWTD